MEFHTRGWWVYIKSEPFIRFLRDAKRSCTEVQRKLYVALDQQYITKTEFQDVLDHAGRIFTLIGDSDRARCHSRFHQVFAGLLAKPTKER